MKLIWMQLRVNDKETKHIISLEDPREVSILGYDTLVSNDVVFGLFIYLWVCGTGNQDLVFIFNSFIRI